MSDLVLFRESNLISTYDEVERTAKAMAGSGFFADTRQASQAIVKIMAGRELGVGPFASMTGVNIIQGKPAFGANIMAASVKKSGRYNYRVTEMTDKACTIEFMEKLDGKWMTSGVSSFTIEDAKRAGTKNLDKFPRNMLFARAMSNGVRWYCPDVMNGASAYTPEELGADVDQDGNVIDISEVKSEVSSSPVFGSTLKVGRPEANIEAEVVVEDEPITVEKADRVNAGSIMIASTETLTPKTPAQLEKSTFSSDPESVIVDGESKPKSDSFESRAESEMSYEEACLVTNSRNQLYGDLDSNILKYMSGSLYKALKDPQLSPIDRADYQRKLTAIDVILKNR